MTRADVLDLITCACVAFTVAALPYVGAPAQTFTLLDFAPDGQVYAIDTGLTRDDCEGALSHAMPGEYLACEAEGA